MSASPTPSVRIAASPLVELRALEVHELYKLRVDVFVHEQQCPFAEFDEVDPAPTTTHFRLLVDGRLAATLRLFPSAAHGGVWHIGRVATAPEQRGNGYAGQLLRAAIAAAGAVPIELGAQSHLEHWYGTFGFVRCGQEYLDEQIPHIPMRREPDSDHRPGDQ